MNGRPQPRTLHTLDVTRGTNVKSAALTVRRLSSALVICLFAVLLTNLAGSAPALAATQATYYVSPSGDDANPGTIALPFKTVQHARDVVRTVNANMTGDIYVYLRGGNYPVTSTIDFVPSDSGTNGNRVIYSAYPGEKPILNGGVQVTGWTQHSETSGRLR
jgi:hypothetical protein